MWANQEIFGGLWGTGFFAQVLCTIQSSGLEVQVKVVFRGLLLWRGSCALWIFCDLEVSKVV